MKKIFDPDKHKEEQNKHIADFSKAVKEGKVKEFLQKDLKIVQDAIDKMELVSVEEKLITVHPTGVSFNEELDKYYKEQNPVNDEKLTSHIEIPITRITETFEHIKNMDDLLNDLISRTINKGGNFEKPLHFNSIRDVNIEHILILEQKLRPICMWTPDQDIVDFILLYRYLMLHEVKLQLLRRLPAPEEVLRIQYPKLFSNMNTKLRDDAGHVRYDERFQIDNNTIERMCVDLFIEIFIFYLRAQKELKSILESSMQTMQDKLK